jgi:RNA polymerase sigma factor (sigma-70 family)
MDEPELLTRPASIDPGDGFAELVRDHADLVYSAARRQLGNSAMLDDVVQAVFILLWRKIKSIKGSVPGWLVKTTYFACRDARKLAARRQYHERAAATMKPEHSNIGTEPAWETYAPVLDEAMARLKRQDRDAVALRYFRGLSFKQVGFAMGTGEDAAKKRVGRAIGRLQKLISKKVAMPTAAMMATQLEAHCINVAPQSLVTTMTASAGSGLKGEFAAAVARKVGMRGVWVGAKIVAMTLIVLGMSVGAAHFTMHSPSYSASAGGAPATPASLNQPADDQMAPFNLDVSAVIDGSDVLSITPAGAAWTHKAWGWPKGLMINGVSFDPHATPTLDEIGLGEADLSSAKIIGRSGRGTVALEKTDNGIAIHFSDPQPGAAPYTMRITFAPISAEPTTLPTTLPTDGSIFLHVKATIDGGDVLTITPQGAEWRHMNMAWPSNVAINDQPWDVRGRPTLNNIGLTDADLSSATVIERTGRDTVVMEKIDTGVAIYFGDALGGGSQYEIKLRFLHMKKGEH